MGLLNLKKPISIFGRWVVSILFLTSLCTIPDLAYASSYIKGPFFYNGNGCMAFHKRTQNGVMRLQIENAFQTDHFDVSYYDQAYKTNQTSGNLTSVSEVGYFDITPQFTLPATKSYKVTIFWNHLSNQGITDTHNLVVSHFTNTNWVNAGKSKLVLNPDSSGYITSGNVSSFSPFTFGSTSSQPLPVKLIYFKAINEKEAVSLRWATASETSNSHFIIQRSTNGKDFEKIGRVKGEGTYILTLLTDDHRQVRKVIKK